MNIMVYELSGQILHQLRWFRMTPVFFIAFIFAAFSAPMAAAGSKSGPGDGLELPQPPLSNSDYWAFADHYAALLDNKWDAQNSWYEPNIVQMNSAMLLTFSIAALSGHTGPARQDARARQIARRLLVSPPWVWSKSSAGNTPEAHGNGWAYYLDDVKSAMHPAADAKVVEALTFAWLARKELGLPESTVKMIEGRISRVARSNYYRYPNSLLNQVNWSMEIDYASALMGRGRARALREMRAQMQRFTREATRPRGKGWLTNLGAGYGFHYYPHKDMSKLNLDSAEYANIVIHSLFYYERARAMGTRPLSRAKRALLGTWLERVLFGYWTHAGYLNWDSGYGYRRLQRGTYWAFSLQGLLTIAATQGFHGSKSYASWAKYIFDRSLILYQRLSDEEQGYDGLVNAALFGVVNEKEKINAIRKTFAARMMANSARAVYYGLGSTKSSAPPPFYAFDPDTGRLAISTPYYNTAILPVTLGAVPYGGLGLARLYDGQQRPVAPIGGLSRSAFGVIVRNASGEAVLRSQQTGRHLATARPPVILTSSPNGRVDRVRRYRRPPYAGPFNVLTEAGYASSSNLRLTVKNSFRSRSIDMSWSLRQVGGPRIYTVEAYLPLYESSGAIYAVLNDGTQLKLGGDGGESLTVPPSDINYFFMQNPGSAGYVAVVKKTKFAGPMTATATYPVRPSRNSQPGPSLTIALASQQRFDKVDITLRIATTGPSAEDAAKTASEL